MGITSQEIHECCQRTLIFKTEAVTTIRPVTCPPEGGVNSCGIEIASPSASFLSAS